MNQMEYSANELKIQEFSEDWDKQILPLLPKDIDQRLKDSGCIKRFRGICNAMALIKSILFFAISKISLAQLAAITQAVGLASMSDTAWRKCLLKIIPFLDTIIQNLLNAIITIPFGKESPKVFLVDATSVRLQGKEQYLERIHVSFDLNNNRIAQLKITDKHTAESFSHFSMNPGEIFIGDAGYSYVRNFVYAIEQGADVIIRINPQNFPLYDIMGNRLKYENLMPNSKEQSTSTLCLLKYNGKYYKARIVIGRLPQNKIKAAQKRKSSVSSKKQKHIRPETTRNAGFVFLVTSLTGEEYGQDAILELYRARWQVELLFKCFKQKLDIRTIRIASPTYARVMIYLWLIIFIITERNLIKTQITFEELQEMHEINLWNVFTISFIRVKQILELKIPFNELPRGVWVRMASHRRKKRQYQNKFIREALLPNLKCSGLKEVFE